MHGWFTLKQIPVILFLPIVLVFFIYQGKKSPRSPRNCTSVLGLDLGKYLISSDRRWETMESDNTTGTESDTSEWDLVQACLTSEYSEDSDECGIYYGHDHMYDTAIGGFSQSGSNLRFARHPMSDRMTNQHMHKMIGQLNVSAGDSGYSGSGSLYPIHETGLTTTDSSGDENSECTVSNSGSSVHENYPAYGRYQKLPDDTVSLESDCNGNDQLDNSIEFLTLHRLPGENIGMILGIEEGKNESGLVTSVAVKSVTLGGAAFRASGGSKGICVSDGIISVNGLDLTTLTHDECIQVFKEMPLHVILGIKRGQKDLPPVSISPLSYQTKAASENHTKSAVKGPVLIKCKHDTSDSEDDGFAGFAVYKLTVEKAPSEKLGLSIVPSYGSTREYYQVRFFM